MLTALNSASAMTAATAPPAAAAVYGAVYGATYGQQDGSPEITAADQPATALATRTLP
jgi:hypothetical protein